MILPWRELCGDRCKTNEDIVGRIRAVARGFQSPDLTLKKKKRQKRRQVTCAIEKSEEAEKCTHLQGGFDRGRHQP